MTGPLSRRQYEPVEPSASTPRWQGARLEQDGSWKRSVPAETKREFEQLLETWRRTGTTFQTYRRSGRPAVQGIGLLGDWLRRTLRETHGVALVESLDPEWLLDERAPAFYACLCLELGTLDYEKGPFYHVYDRGEAGYLETTRYSDTHLSHGFHTDSTARDNLPMAVGLLCIRQSDRGGENRLVNMLEVHERMRSRRPDLLRALYRETIRDRAVTPGDPAGWQTLADNRYPVFSQGIWAECLVFRYMRRWLEKGHEKAGIALDPLEVEALDFLDSTMNDPQLVHTIKCREGEILFLNNLVVAHDRAAYEDPPGRQRLMLRAWIYGESGEGSPSRRDRS